MATKKNSAAVQLGRRGGKNSRKNLPADEVTRLARKAAEARWGKPKAAEKG